MKKVTLKFKSAKRLWEFCKETNLDFFEANLRDRVLFCLCSDEELAVARDEFEAEITHVDG